MSNELNYYGTLSETGLTVIARVYDSAGAQVGSDVSCVEATGLSIYTGDMVTAPLGKYGIRFFSGSSLLGQGIINWSGTQEIDIIVPSQSSGSNVSILEGEIIGTIEDIITISN